MAQNLLKLQFFMTHFLDFCWHFGKHYISETTIIVVFTQEKSFSGYFLYKAPKKVYLRKRVGGFRKIIYGFGTVKATNLFQKTRNFLLRKTRKFLLRKQETSFYEKARNSFYWYDQVSRAYLEANMCKNS